tara:strand:+ start:1955 stop:2338 length:384 start_codon:yes stop_codon:yes gene_type:complete
VSGLRSRRKGHNFERELARVLSEHWPELNIKRGSGQSRCGSDAPDVDMPSFWVEAKRHKRCNIKAALKQAIEASAEDEKRRMPIAICKDDREEATVTMRFEDFLCLAGNFFVHTGYLKGVINDENEQ